MDPAGGVMADGGGWQEVHNKRRSKMKQPGRTFSRGRASQKPKSRPLAKQKDANLRWEDRKMGGDLDAFAISATEEESKPVEEKKQAPAPTPAPEPPKETPAALPSRAAPVSTEAPPPPVSFADAAKRKDSSGGRPPSKEPSPPAPSVPPPVEKVDTSTPPPPTPAPVAVPPPAAPRPASPPPPAEPEKKEPSAPPPPPVSKPAPAPSAALEKKDSDVVAVTPSFILDPALKPVTQSTTPEETAPTDPAPATAPLVEGVEDIESAEEGEEFESPMTDPDVAPSAEDSKEDSPGTQKGMFLQPNDYGPETWSPVNPEGLKRYDRDFLIKFQQHPLAQRPLNIQPTEVLLDKPTVKVIRTPESPGGVGQMNFGSMKRNQYVPTRHSSEVDFAPSFVRNQPGMMPPMSSQSMYGRAQAQQVRGSRGSQQGNRAGPPRVLPSLSISSAKVELATAEKAWLPKRQQVAEEFELNSSFLSNLLSFVRAAVGLLVRGPFLSSAFSSQQSATHESLDEEKRQMEELERQVRAILNKLTPQKFDTLVSKVKALKIETPQALEKVIDLVFAKAVDEPNFAEAYAKMCLEVQEKKISITDEKGEKVEYKFKKLLLNRCQQEFELAETGDKEKKTYEERIEAAETEEKRKELRAEMDEAAMKVRKRYLGVIVFIGQLFKLGMLTMPIMYRCMDQLLEHWKTTLVEDYIECLCRLLTTIGYRLEFYFKASKDDPLRQPLHKTIPPNLRQENLQRLGPVLQQMKNLSDNKKELSSRVRFGLKDVIELQQNGWVPRARQNANAPKTIDQIHTEAEMEEHKKAAERSLPLASNTGGGGGGGGKQRRMEDKQRRNPITDSEGFQFKGGNKTYQKVDIDASKVPMVKRQEEDDAAMSLRPTTRGWGMRPAGMSQGMEPSLATGGSGGAPFLSVVNKYAMLDASSSLGASSEQMGRRGHGGGGSNYKSSSQNLPPRLQKQQKGGLASDRERSSSRGGSGRRSVPPTAAPVLPMAKDGAPPAPWARSTRSQDAPPARTEGSPLLRTAGDATLPRAGRKNLSQSPARQNAAALERRAVNGTEKLDAQKLDKGKVKEVAKKLVAIVSQHSDCDESIESVIGVYEPKSVGPLLLEVLDQSVDVLSPKTWPLLREILGDIATRPDLASVGALTSCLQMFAANLGNLALDFPQIFDFFGEVTSSLVVKQPSPFAFLCEVLKSLKSPDKIDEYDVPEERWQYAEKTFAACVKKMSDRIGKDSLATSWRKGGKDLEEFLSPEQSLSSLGIEFLVPPRAIILSLLESNCTVAKNGQKELDFQPIVHWSENDSPVRAGSEEFIQALIQAVCDFCITEGTGDACKFVEKNLEACILLLKRFADEKSSVCKDHPELEYIFAFQNALKWREFPKSLQMHQLLTFLIDHDIISTESITDWSKNTKADNVALTNCKRLLNYIKQEAEMEPDEDDEEERESSVPSDTTAAPSQPPATSSVAKEGESSSHS
ncbi:unnamed protein product [Cyprideis torosa]|uniref:W2 domain-containing protein n=1 Tax=Cyprideis torosa TaxID=163714 RepID=A0A7R8ZNL3_9CRUS|nr:unnamed protein product [Cyprideis torosa]CAG0888024.1 unnamed protein product [Cyprideis torosa]